MNTGNCTAALVMHLRRESRRLLRWPVLRCLSEPCCSSGDPLVEEGEGEECESTSRAENNILTKVGSEIASVLEGLRTLTRIQSKASITPKIARRTFSVKVPIHR